MNYLPGLFTHSFILISYILITCSIKWKLPKHLTQGWTCTLFDSASLLLEPNQIERKTDEAIHESAKFHLSLPLSRAALVPLWAMALQSVREALSQDFPFPPQRLKCWSPQISSVSLLSSAASLGSKVQVQKIYRHLVLRSEKTQKLQAFTNNCNPLIWLRRRLTNCLCIFKVITQPNTPETPNKPLLLPRQPGQFGFDKRAEERRAVPHSVILK